MTKVERFRAALTREGLVPELDADGDLRFTFEGGHYVLFAEPTDESYVRILFPNFWPIESDEERTRAFRAATVATRRCKGAKVWLRDDETDVCASIESFLPGPEYLDYVLARMIAAVQYAARQFRDEMHGASSDDEATDGLDAPLPGDVDALFERFLREIAPDPPDDAAPDDSPGDRLAGYFGDAPPGGDAPGTDDPSAAPDETPDEPPPAR